MPRRRYYRQIFCMAPSEVTSNPPPRSGTAGSDSSSVLEERRSEFRRLVAASRNACTLDYLRLVVIRQADRAYAERYVRASIDEYVALTNVLRVVDDKNFHKRNVWKWWCYIRDLVKKYVADVEAFAEMIRNLDAGLEKATVFQLREKVWRVLGAETLPLKPADSADMSKIDDEQFTKLRDGGLDTVINQCAKNRCFKPRDTWRYSDLFDINLNTITAW
jgi:hypothetical protein